VASAPGEVVLAIDSLRVRARRRSGAREIVRGVSLHVDAGEVLGIVGASGCGKTTTLRAAIRHLPAGVEIVSGTITFKGQDVRAMSDERLRELRGGQIGIVVQNPAAALNPVKTVRAQMLGLAGQHGLTPTPADLERLLGEVGLDDPERVLHSYPHELSGGMAQRVLIATALALHPALILADEPTSALDVTVQAQIMELLRRLIDDRGLAAVLVTHDIALVAQYCDRIVVMNEGEVVEADAADVVIRAPQAAYTQELLGAAEVRDAIGTVELVGGADG